MKMYKKSDLTIIDGLIVRKDSNDVIVVDPRVISQANELDTLVQKAKYLKAQPSATPMPSLDGFERVSDHDVIREFEVVTPTMDKCAEEALAIMEEMDDMAVVKEVNNILRKFSALIEFAGKDFVLDHEVMGELDHFDTPVIGSVLELTPDDVYSFVAFACGLVRDDEEDGEKPKRRVIEGCDLTDEEVETILGIIANHDPDADPELISIKE